MRCYVQTYLDAPIDAVWTAVKKPDTLFHVTRGFLGFSGLDHTLPEWREGMSYQTRFWFFHVLPAWWKHTMNVMQIDEAQRMLASNEHGGIISKWNHTIRVSPATSGCVYSDEIEIKAGLFTALVWLYANVFYRYRQRRWRKFSRKLGG